VERHVNFQLFALFLTLDKKFRDKFFSNAMSFFVEELSVSHFFLL